MSLSSGARRRRVTARGLAIQAVVAAEAGERANMVLPRLLAASELDQKDRHFATEMVYGCLRMLRACDWLVAQFSRRELEPEVMATARVGAYQLAFMRVPSYAAVAATVSEGPERARPLLNAVLRKVATLVDPGPVPWPDLAVRLSYPDWVVQRLGQDLGPQRALAALETMNQAATVAVRPDGYVQDPASQQVAAYVATTVGLGALALDICAAPGGKATYMASQGLKVVAADISPQRVAVVEDNAARLGLGAGQLAVVVADGCVPPFPPASFAAVLVDAPCSGLGVLRRRPDARWRVRPEDVGRLARLQRRLLAAAAEMVAPGGALVYSVCTLTRAETTEVGQWAVPELGWQVVAPPGPPWEAVNPGALLLPQTAGTDGMYVLALRRPA